MPEVIEPTSTDVKIQSHLPVVIWETKEVVGMIPLYVSLGLTGCETSVLLSGQTIPLEWQRRETYHGVRHIAVVPISMSEWRQGSFPVHFRYNPQFYFPQFYAERSVLHWGAPALPAYWTWLFYHGATVRPVMTDPEASQEVPRWSLELPMLSSAECAYVDIDWTQFAPDNTTAAMLAFERGDLPGFIQHAYVSADMSQPMLGLSMAEATGILRLYRSDLPVAGTYPVPMTITAKDGLASPFVLELVVS